MSMEPQPDPTRLDEVQLEAKAMGLYQETRGKVVRGEHFTRTIWLVNDQETIELNLWSLSGLVLKRVVEHQKKLHKPYATIQIGVTCILMTERHEHAGVATSTEPFYRDHLLLALDHKKGAFKLWTGVITGQGKRVTVADPKPVEAPRRDLRDIARRGFRAANTGVRAVDVRPYDSL